MCLALIPLFAPPAITANLRSLWATRWPAPGEKALSLLKQAGVGYVLTPVSEEAGADPAVQASKNAGITPVAELRGARTIGEIEQQARMARRAGYEGLAYAAVGDESSLRAFAASQPGVLQFVILKPEQAHWNVAPALAVLKAGQWPGARMRDPSVATASEAPWVDANSYLIAFLKGLFPERPAILGYEPDADAGVAPGRVVPYHSVELAVAEAAAAGGSVILTLPDAYRGALLQGSPDAVAAWNSLAKTIGFLRARADRFAGPAASRVAVAASGLEEHGELLNMMYRRNLCPVVFPRAAIPEFERNGRSILVSDGGSAPKVLAFVAKGGHALVAPAAGKDRPWWPRDGMRKKSETPEFEVYSYGEGTVTAYREPVADPAEFALDVIDAEGAQTRDLRLWNSDSTVGILHRLPRGLSLALVNYGAPVEDDFMVRVEGAFARATLESPDGEPKALKTARRGSGTEFEVPGMNRIVTILLE